jgi:hypothetical protein
MSVAIAGARGFDPPLPRAASAGRGGAGPGGARRLPADHREVPGDDDPREAGEAVHGVLRIV